MNNDDLETKSKKCKNDNTIKCERRADKAFTTFLIAMGVPENETDYWNYTEPELDNFLAKFWFGARKYIPEGKDDSEPADPEITERMYKANSLCNIRYGLTHILKQKGHLYDIMNRVTASFTKSQEAFTDAIKELKAKLKADVTPYPEILEEGTVFISHSWSQWSMSRTAWLWLSDWLSCQLSQIRSTPVWDFYLIKLKKIAGISRVM